MPSPTIQCFFATGGTDNAFEVIYARLNSDRLLLTAERPVISKLLEDHPYTLFVFSNQEQTDWHFVNVKYDTDDPQETPPIPPHHN